MDVGACRSPGVEDRHPSTIVPVVKAMRDGA